MNELSFWGNMVVICSVFGMIGSFYFYPVYLAKKGKAKKSGGMVLLNKAQDSRFEIIAFLGLVFWLFVALFVPKLT